MRGSSFFKYLGLFAVISIIATVALLRSYSPEQLTVTLRDDDAPFLKNLTSGICPRQPILTMVRGGRLGNLIGTYATLYALAQTYDYHAVVPPDVLNELNNYFPNLSLPPTSTLPESCRKVHRQAFPSNISQPSVNVQLPMYVARLITFHPYRQEITKEFEFHPDVRQKAQHYIRSVKQGHKVNTVVGVHVRRTDYVKYIQHRWGDTVVDENYIHKAMEYVINGHQNVSMGNLQQVSRLFLVLSDDIAWCKEHLNRTRFDMTFQEKPESPGMDMAILTQCDQVIISVGSYGFWGAYLSQKSVIFPDKKAPFYDQVDQIHIPGWTRLST